MDGAVDADFCEDLGPGVDGGLEEWGDGGGSGGGLEECEDGGGGGYEYRGEAVVCIDMMRSDGGSRTVHVMQVRMVDKADDD